MMKHSISTALTLFFLSLGVAPRQLAALGKTANRVECDPVGRVLTQGFLYFKPGSLLCKGDHLQVVNATSTELLCFPSGQFVTVTDRMEDASKCGASETGLDPCLTEMKPHCFKSHGLIRPYGSIVTDNRPFFSWRPVKGATRYIMAIKGHNVDWQKKIDGTSMPYPPELQAFKPDDVYKVTIVALQGDSAISEDSSALNILSESKAKEVARAVERVRKLNLPKAETAPLDLDSIYISRWLLDQAINALEIQVKQGSQNPVVYRVLGERYLEAELLDYAEPRLRTAAQLAEAARNHIELQKARAELEIVNRYRSVNQ